MSAAKMPSTVAWVAHLRVVLGAQVVDRAMAAAQQARREFVRRSAADGEEAARHWLRQQRFSQGRFWAVEGGCEVGICPDGGGVLGGGARC